MDTAPACRERQLRDRLVTGSYPGDKSVAAAGTDSTVLPCVGGFDRTGRSTACSIVLGGVNAQYGISLRMLFSSQ